MNAVIDYAIKNKVLKQKNYILEKVLMSKKNDDKIIEILTKEVSEFILHIINEKEKT